MDDIDRTSELQEQLETLAVQSAQRAAKNIAIGVPGDCDKCGEFSTRLMDGRFFQRAGRLDIARQVESGICPRCRDRHKMP